MTQAGFDYNIGWYFPYDLFEDAPWRIVANPPPEPSYSPEEVDEFRRAGEALALSQVGWSDALFGTERQYMDLGRGGGLERPIGGCLDRGWAAVVGDPSVWHELFGRFQAYKVEVTLDEDTDIVALLLDDGASLERLAPILYPDGNPPSLAPQVVPAPTPATSGGGVSTPVTSPSSGAAGFAPLIVFDHPEATFDGGNVMLTPLGYNYELQWRFSNGVIEISGHPESPSQAFASGVPNAESETITELTIRGVTAYHFVAARAYPDQTYNWYETGGMYRLRLGNVGGEAEAVLTGLVEVGFAEAVLRTEQIAFLVAETPVRIDYAAIATLCGGDIPDQLIPILPDTIMTAFRDAPGQPIVSIGNDAETLGLVDMLNEVLATCP